jgi:hypothetical protein
MGGLGRSGIDLHKRTVGKPGHLRSKISNPALPMVIRLGPLVTIPAREEFQRASSLQGTIKKFTQGAQRLRGRGQLLRVFRISLIPVEAAATPRVRPEGVHEGLAELAPNLGFPSRHLDHVEAGRARFKGMQGKPPVRG